MKCWYCGRENRARAPLGSGTLAAERKKKLNQNELAIGQILCDREQQLTVRQVQGVLYAQGVKRQRRREKISGGGWNYHQVQIVLSMLLGTKPKTISATKTKEIIDEDQYRYAVPILRYFMTPEQKERFKDILLKGGVIKFDLIQLCRYCGRPLN